MRRAKRQSARRILSFLLVLCLFLTGCTGKDAQETGAEGSESSEIKTEDAFPQDETSEEIVESSEEVTRLLAQKNQEYDPASCILTAAEGFEPAESRNYTVMVYMIGSNLESAAGNATLDLAEMEGAGLDYDRTNLLVYTGGSMRWNSDVPCDRNCVLDMAKAEDERIVASTERNADMGAPDALIEFVNFATDNYPAEHYALFFWDHGGGPLWGYGSDELFGGDGLLLYELNEALSKTRFIEGEKLDLIGFDACMMGNLETMIAVSGAAEYFVGSEELEPGAGWNYSFLSLLNETDDPVEIGKEILARFEEYYDAKRTATFDPDLTLVLTDLGKLQNVRDHLSALSETLSESMVSEEGYRILHDSRTQARSFGALDNGEDSAFYYDLVDLWSMASLLSGQTHSDTREKANALVKVLNEFIIAFYTNLEDAHGISVYFPSMNRPQFYEMRETYRAYGISKEYMTLLSEVVKRQQSDVRKDWIVAAPVFDGTEYTVRLTDDQNEHVSNIYLTVLTAIDGMESEFTTLLERYPLRADENGVIHLEADPQMIALRTGETSVIWPVRVVEESQNRFIFQTRNTRVRTDSLLQFGEEEFESISVTLKQTKADGTLSIQSIHTVSEDISFGGKDTIDVSHYKKIYYSYTGMVPSFREDGTPLQFADWEEGSIIGSMNTSLSDDFSFTLKHASEEFETIYYVITIEDTNGENYNSEITQISLSPEAEVIREKTGQGELTFYLYEDHAELAGYTGTDTEIRIPETVDTKPVTIIRSSVFGKVIYYSSNGYYPLEKVTLPETITEIRESAFRHCIALKEINLPKNLRIIGELAFEDCRSLTSIELPSHLESIGIGAFSHCSSLSEIEIPASVNEIGDAVFAGCTNLIEIRMGEGALETQRIVVTDSLLYDQEQRRVLACPGAKEGIVTIPEGALSIGERAFGYCAISEVILPDSLEVIDHYAFYSCPSLTFPKLPDSLREIGVFAFDTDMQGIRQEAIPEETSIIYIGPHVTYIGFNAFGGVANKAFSVSEENSMFSDAEGCLMNKAGDALIEFATGPESMLKVPEGCVSLSLRSVEFVSNYDSVHCPVMLFIPEGMRYIGLNERAISIYNLIFCSAIPAVLDYADQNNYRSIRMIEPLQDTARMDTENGVMTFWLFESYAALTAYEGTDEVLEVPQTVEGRTVTTIGDSENALFAFSSDAYETVRKVKLPSTIEVISDHALEGTQIRVINLPDGLRYIGDKALYCRVTLQTLPDSIEYLGEQWLSDWNKSFVKGEGLRIPSQLGEVSGMAFKSVRPFIVDADHPLYTVIDGMLCSKDGKTLIAGYSVDYRTPVTIPDGIEVIGEGAFYRTAISEITIPESVREIGDHAFGYCSMLERINFNEGLETIGAYAFEFCSARNLVFPSTLKSIGTGAFRSSGAQWVEFTGETESIGADAFEYCDDLEYVLLHEGLKEIKRDAFNGAALRKLSLPGSLQRIESYAFGYPGEETMGEAIVLEIGPSLKEVSASSFIGLNILAFEVSAENPYLASEDGLLTDRSGKELIMVPSLAEGLVVIPEGTFKLGQDAFTCALLLTDIEIPDSLKCIDRGFGRNYYPDGVEPTVHCGAGSAAEKWAIERGWPYTTEP